MGPALILITCSQMLFVMSSTHAIHVDVTDLLRKAESQHETSLGQKNKHIAKNRSLSRNFCLQSKILIVL
jgi:hypothetical protein